MNSNAQEQLKQQTDDTLERMELWGGIVKSHVKTIWDINGTCLA